MKNSIIKKIVVGSVLFLFAAKAAFGVAPISTFKAISRTNCLTPCTSTFTNGSAFINGGPNPYPDTTYYWDFGNGVQYTNTVNDGYVAYLTAGVYTVSLTASNAAGKTTTVSTDLMVVKYGTGNWDTPAPSSETMRIATTGDSVTNYASTLVLPGTQSKASGRVTVVLPRLVYYLDGTTVSNTISLGASADYVFTNAVATNQVWTLAALTNGAHVLVDCAFAASGTRTISILSPAGVTLNMYTATNSLTITNFPAQFSFTVAQTNRVGYGGGDTGR